MTIKTFEQYNYNNYKGNKSNLTDYMGYNIHDYSIENLENKLKEARWKNEYHKSTAFRNALEFVKERDVDYYKELIFIELVDSEFINDIPTVYDEEE